jgi:hypothetical protein
MVRQKLHLQTKDKSILIPIERMTRERQILTISVGANNNSHANNHTNNNNPNTKSKPSSPTVMIQSDNFLQNFHHQIRAAKYKVHAPNCDCVKVERLRKRYYSINNLDSSQQPNISSGSGNGTQKNDSSTTTSPSHPSRSPYSREIQFDIDGSFSTDFNNTLLLSYNKNDTATTKSTTNNIFDNLTVIPDTARPSALYISENTNWMQFQQNGMGCEQKLSVEIFGSIDDNSRDNDAGRNNGSSFKVSCAICLLTNHYQNGFVAIVSNSLNEIQSLLENARYNAAARIKSMNSLHSDHAQFVCALKISTVRSFLSSSGGNRMTRLSRSVLIKQILNQMVESGVVLSRDAQSFMDGEATAAAAKIEIGHHLTSFIQLWTEKDTNNNNSNDDQPTSALQQYPYIMVIGYHDTNSQWTLDLPGGKRHLGENTFQCAIREVEEECSLQLNQEWMEGRVPIEYGGLLASNDVVPTADDCDGGVVVTVLESFGDAFLVVPASLDVIVGNG